MLLPPQLVDLVARIMAYVPPWVRIYRIQRDIPMPLVSSGVEKGNLRELALARMGHLGLKCRDVRTREAGIQGIHHKVCVWWGGGWGVGGGGVRDSRILDCAVQWADQRVVSRVDLGLLGRTAARRRAADAATCL